MGILSRLRRGGREGSARNDQQTPLVNAAMERIVDLNPQLRLARRYQAQLEPAVSTSLKYVSDLVAALPSPREASADVWSSDPYIHAFFATPDDIAQAFSRSPTLRAYFEQNMDAPDVYAVLGMTMVERQILGVALEGETMRRDVIQKTVSFSDHQVRICGRSDSDLRQEIIRLLVDQLGLDGLARISADKSRRDMLEQERALLKTRLILLERQGAGMRAVLGSDATPGSEELTHLQEQIKENETNLNSLGLRADAAERALKRVCEVLADPSPHIYIESKQFQLDRMNVALSENSAQEGEKVTFQIARVPTTPPQMRAFALVRFARADLLPAANMFDEAARLLI